jgi:hypothetical protein
MRRTVTTRYVVAIALVLFALCIGWAFVAQSLVPAACSYSERPVNAQYLHCS